MAIEILVIFHLLFTFGLLLNPLAQELDARFHIPKGEFVLAIIYFNWFYYLLLLLIK